MKTRSLELAEQIFDVVQARTGQPSIGNQRDIETQELAKRIQACAKEDADYVVIELCKKIEWLWGEIQHLHKFGCEAVR